MKLFDRPPAQGLLFAASLMGLLDWLKKTFGGTSGGSSGADRPAPAPPRPAFPSQSVTATSSPAKPAPVTQPPRRAEPIVGQVVPPRTSDFSNLELGQFAPLAANAARSLATGLGSIWGNPWFGRRDLIPPTEDPRTLIIDRAMVGQGIITPEELVEIHAVGREMDAIRPDLALVRTQTEAAVRERTEEKERRKQELRRAAAERKEARAKAVAERRRTDIIFLGRGVSKGLADRRSNAERLQALGLPVLSAPADVAEALGLTISRLRWLAFHNEAARRTHYVTFTVPKRSGGVRTLSAPHRDLRAAQDWILTNILARLPLHAAAHGFVPGRSTVSNATPHVGQFVVVNCDLKDFFPSITVSRVKFVFRSLGYSPAVATVLALLCTEAPRQKVTYAGVEYHVALGPRGLPQGAPTSPALSNLAAARLEVRLTGIAHKLGWTYTRYADDLTFSAPAAAAEKTGYLLARIRHIAEHERFTVNEAKTRVQRRNRRQEVTGVVVNDRPGAPRKLVRRIRSILHRAQREGLAAQNRQQLPHFESWLSGTIAYIEMLNPTQGKGLRSAWQNLYRVP